MVRRTLLLGAAAALAMPPMAASAAAERTLSLGDMDFNWRHIEDRLFGRLSAPGSGWLAVGFNRDRQLAGTRFVIAAVAGQEIEAEVHVAQPPNHRSIEELTGQPSALADLSGHFDGRRSALAFSLPHRTSDRWSQDISSGQRSHLMLAWSHEADFTHHSAWRGHKDVVL